MRTKISAAVISGAIAVSSVMFSAPTASAAAYGVLYHKKDNNNPTSFGTTYSKTAAHC